MHRGQAQLPCSCNTEFRDIENRQGVTSLSQVVVRASDPQYARFSTHGISKVELFVDGKQVTTYTKNPTSDYIDYAFDTDVLGLTNGVHEIEAVAYDDYWQFSVTTSLILVNSDGGGMQSMRQQASDIYLLAESGANGIPKNSRSAQAQQVIIKLCYLSHTSGLGNPKFGHAWVRLSSKDNYGFYGREKFRGKSYRKIEVPMVGTCYYYYNANNLPANIINDSESWEKLRKKRLIQQQTFDVKVTRKKEHEILNRINNDRKALEKNEFGEPWYALNGFNRWELIKSQSHSYSIPTGEKAYNCATWIKRIIPSKCRIDFRPWYIGNYASCLNQQSDN